MGIFKPNIEKLKSKGDAKGLIKALAHKSPTIREGAAEALGQLGGFGALIPLIDATRDSWYTVRETAAQSLVTVVGNESLAGDVEPIPQALGDALKESCSCQGSHLSVSKFLIEALVKIGSANAQSAIIEVLTDDGLRLGGEQRHLWDALAKIGWEPSKDKVSVLYWAAKGRVDKCVEIGKPAVDVLMSLVNHGRFLVSAQETACKALGQLGDPRATKLLIGVSNAHFRNVREAAVEALGRIADPQAMEPLFSKAIHSKFHSVEAVYALRNIAQIGEQRAKELLIKVLKESWRRDVLKAVTLSLDALGWQPGPDELGAKFWAIEGQWKKCLEMGDMAIEPILRIGSVNIGELEEACKTFKGSQRFKDVLETYLKYLDHELSRAIANVQREEKRWGGSSFPDYYSRDRYQAEVDSLRQMISITQEELKKLG